MPETIPGRQSVLKTCFHWFGSKGINPCMRSRSLTHCASVTPLNQRILGVNEKPAQLGSWGQFGCEEIWLSPSQGSPCPCPYPCPYSSLAERLGPTLVTSLFPSSRQERNRTVHIIQSAFLYFYKENSFILARKVYQLRGKKAAYLWKCREKPEKKMIKWSKVQPAAVQKIILICQWIELSRNWCEEHNSFV